MVAAAETISDYVVSSPKDVESGIHRRTTLRAHTLLKLPAVPLNDSKIASLPTYIRQPRIRLKQVPQDSGDGIFDRIEINLNMSQAEIAAELAKIPDTSEKPYSMREAIIHTSFEQGLTERMRRYGIKGAPINASANMTYIWDEIYPSRLLKIKRAISTFLRK